MFRPRTVLKYKMACLLRKAGFKAWAIPRQVYELYALLIIACNRLCPQHPERAYMMLLHHVRGINEGQHTDPTKWRCAEVGSKETIRLDALQWQAKHKDFDHCPACGAKTQLNSEPVFFQYADENDEWPGFVSMPDAPQNLPQRRTFERKPPHTHCVAVDNEAGKQQDTGQGAGNPR